MQNKLNRQKRIVVINDLSCYGRCSLTVALPILSAMGLESCPLPTALLSASGAFPGYKKFDLTLQMQEIIEHWKEMDIKFDGISTGLFFSEKQLEIAEDFIRHFKQESTMVFIDPILGDNGRLYSVTTPELCAGIKRLLPYADILTPNLTECCTLLDLPFSEGVPEETQLHEMAIKLSELGPKKIVITGLVVGEKVLNYVFDAEKGSKFIGNKRVGKDRSGTGDVFSAILSGYVLNGDNFNDAVEKTTSFLYNVINLTLERDIPESNGVCFENFMKNT